MKQMRKQLILKHAKEITYIDENDDSPNYGNDGRPVDNEDTQHTIKAATFKLNRDDLELYEAGKYTTKDRKVYVVEPLYDTEDNLIEMEVDNRVVINNDTYELAEDESYAEYGYRKFIATKVVT